VTPARRFLPLLAVLMLALPEMLYACPVCFDPRAENRLAFLGTTVFLSLLPLGMVAGAWVWFRRQYRERDYPRTSRPTQ
jgi:hypothetical protein